LNPYCLEIANIREQCSWVHPDRKAATAKAFDLIASAAAKAAWLVPLQERQVSVTEAALVIGGGVAGMQAALDIADAGFQTYLVEKQPTLGGRAAQLTATFPTMERMSDLLGPMVQRVMEYYNIRVFTDSTVEKVDGYVGNFRATLEQPDRVDEINVGAIIVATGTTTFDAVKKPEFGFGTVPNVITSLQFEQLVNPNGPTGGQITIDGKTPANIVFVQCVGSRDATTGNAHCSRICCMVGAKQAHMARQQLADAKITTLYADVRTFGKGHEEFYDSVRKEGVRYRRGYVSEIFKRGDRAIVRFEDTLIQKPVELEADLVVLEVGLTPSADTEEIANVLGLPRSSDGFLLEIHPKMRPVETAVDGVFLAGTCQGPKDIVDTLAQARAAASSALAPLCRGQVKVESATSSVDEQRCAGCGICVATCPYGAPALNSRTGKARVNAVLCKGCGACEAACPSKAIQVMQSTPRQIMSQIAVFA
jgi:heterodisulfide reductase subunit A